MLEAKYTDILIMELNKKSNDQIINSLISTLNHMVSLYTVKFNDKISALSHTAYLCSDDFYS
jgi:hypothetical protein